MSEYDSQYGNSYSYDSDYQMEDQNRMRTAAWAAGMSGGGMFGGAIQAGAMHIEGWLNRRAAKRAFQNMKDWEKQKLKNQIQWIRSDAEKAGIHPLAALGISPASGSPYASAGTFDDIGNMGQAIGDAVNKALDSDAKAMRAALLKTQQAQARREGIEADIADVQLQQLKNTPSTGPGPSAENKFYGIMGQGDPAKYTYDLTDPQLAALGGGFRWNVPQVDLSKQLGVRTGTEPLYVDFIDPRGRSRRLLSQPASEPMESDWAAQIQNVGLGIRDRAEGLAHKIFIWGKEAKEWRNMIRRMRPEAPPGKEYRYNYFWDYWQLRPKKGLLFDKEEKRSKYNSVEYEK